MLRQAGGLLLLLVALNTAQSAPIQCFLDNGVDVWLCDEDVKFCFTGLALVSARHCARTLKGVNPQIHI